MSWPSGKLPFECQKITKNLTFLKKVDKNCHFFSTKLSMAILLKKWQFLSIFFFKNVKFLEIFWHSNGNFPEGQNSMLILRVGRFSEQIFTCMGIYCVSARVVVYSVCVREMVVITRVFVFISIWPHRLCCYSSGYLKRRKSLSFLSLDGHYL